MAAAATRVAESQKIGIFHPAWVCRLTLPVNGVFFLDPSWKNTLSGLSTTGYGVR